MVKIQKKINQVNIELRKAKTNYFSSRIVDQKCNPKKVWRAINNLLGKQNKNSEVNELKVQGNILNNSKDIAESFNNYFSNIGPDLASQIPTPNCNFDTYVKQVTSEFAAFQ